MMLKIYLRGFLYLRIADLRNAFNNHSKKTDMAAVCRARLCGVLVF
jgi:hypothetical protein